MLTNLSKKLNKQAKIGEMKIFKINFKEYFIL